MEIKGIIQDIKQRDKGYSIKILEEWYSGWAKCPCGLNDTVSIVFEPNTKDGTTYKNIQKLDVTTVAPVNEIILGGLNPTQDRIGKQWAINAAIKCLEIETNPLTEENIAIKAALLIKIREGI